MTRFKPGPLSDTQRALIMRAADSNDVLNSFEIEMSELTSFHRLMDRGFFKFAFPDDSTIFALTETGQKVATAIRKLRADTTGVVDPRDFLSPRLAKIRARA